uniref:DNA repair protein RadC n=1 Tax=Candidatus Kentrum sp. MB TaxID=2138164 RepID=A0A450XMF7_9GAMM|nr:MAG: DNA repair protein RadC [Candidatus Kentron sp. MB]VFK34423.1 MAG: DNA repair protein RadC [Candidatus Kentron sp. MB]VFK76702.1 MAG: DNA repair protein RadC [Candidatus Kentron sp. MB]
MNIRLTEQERIRVLNGEDVFAIMQKVLLRENKCDRDKEHFLIIGLDADSRILCIGLVVLGGVTSVTVKPMETFRVAVLKNAVSVILVHNHPAENVTPSDETDKDLTDRLILGRISPYSRLRSPHYRHQTIPQLRSPGTHGRIATKPQMGAAL